MLVCDLCERIVEESDYQHFIDNHPEVFEFILEKYVYDAEYAKFDPRESALTAGERNPSLR